MVAVADKHVDELLKGQAEAEEVHAQVPEAGRVVLEELDIGKKDGKDEPEDDATGLRVAGDAEGADRKVAEEAEADIDD